ncbi:heavy-metal-associated domain-containing protein [Microvirga puerhi]|uniref:Heavy-metal-associated domain-containing protein n=1 Tax=Microvirga puerhi TaxID=2876078 RepID=A0ABS7VUZ7_9HYPH|nr:heavy-metal-associated domain-containing protein [Microvirga puerhi]MBZ6078772.1 heavy-metal-associated domain-containing protein [Microvirga puerhi]
MQSFLIPSMRCGGCLDTVTRAVQALDPQARVEADLAKRTIAVSSTETADALQAALQDAGYPATPVAAPGA